MVALRSMNSLEIGLQVTILATYRVAGLRNGREVANSGPTGNARTNMAWHRGFKFEDFHPPPFPSTSISLSQFKMPQVKQEVVSPPASPRKEESRPSRPHTDSREKRSRSRSPARGDRPRSPSRERYRDSRRNRSPNGYHEEESRHSSYDRRGAPPGAAREQRMSQVRESSQQDRRVYVGNLPYEVSWQALKAFMKEGMYHH